MSGVTLGQIHIEEGTRPSYLGMSRYAHGLLNREEVPGPFLQACMFKASKLYETAASKPHLTWREVGICHGIEFSKTIPWSEVKNLPWDHKKRIEFSCECRAFNGLTAAICNAIKNYCLTEGKPFPFRKR